MSNPYIYECSGVTTRIKKKIELEEYTKFYIIMIFRSLVIKSRLFLSLTRILNSLIHYIYIRRKGEIYFLKSFTNGDN